MMSGTNNSQVRMSRVALLGVVLIACGIAACNKDQNQRDYCDATGCYHCANGSCYPVPGQPTVTGPGTATACDNDSACGAGQVCNLGTCQAACSGDSDCKSGDVCISGRCRPSTSTQCGVSGALCTGDAQCGSGRTCVGNACAASCQADATKCVPGQVCQNGACVEDPHPAMAQCVFDYDCSKGQGFRCINAYCLPQCSDNTACTGGAACIKGVCRADRRATAG